MSKRLQVILDDSEIDDLRAAAQARGTTVSQWVRDALAAAQARQPRGDIDQKLAAIRKAASYEFPTGDIDRMLDEIERGRSVRDE